jgi:hypothetical protein
VLVEPPFDALEVPERLTVLSLPDPTGLVGVERRVTAAG